jgi:hypothetical protein
MRILVVEPLMVGCEVPMSRTRSQDAGKKGPWELQLRRAPGEGGDPEVLVGLGGFSLPVSLKRR